VKYENNNLGTMVIILWWIIDYEPFKFLWVYEGTCFGYVMSKACQYAMNDDNVFVCLILMNVKNAQTSLQKIITWMKILKKVK
jgi:hypothetical protein